MSDDAIRIEIVKQEEHWLNRLISWIVNAALQRRMRRRVRNARVDRNAQCPACGWGNGKIQFLPGEFHFADNTKTKGVIAHRCNICDANWIEKPIIAAKEWALELPDMRGNDE